MSVKLFRQTIASVFLTVLVNISWASDKLSEDLKNGTPPDVHSRLTWKLHDLATHAPIIMVGNVKECFGFQHESVFRLFRVNVDESIKGEVKDSTIYLVESLPADSIDAPPVLFPAKYLLFLSPADNGEAAQDLKMIAGTNTPLHVYSVYAGWKGAISLDSQWSERSNKKIEAEYGRDSSEEMTVAVRSVCAYMRAPGDEKMKLAEQFRRQGGVYKQFIDDALTEKVPPKP